MTGVKVSSYNAATKKAVFKWDKRDAASGYQYQIYKAGSDKVLYSGYTTNTSVTLTGKLEKGTVYKVRVRAYRSIDNGEKKAYGNWSDYKRVSLAAK